MGHWGKLSFSKGVAYAASCGRGGGRGGRGGKGGGGGRGGGKRHAGGGRGRSGGGAGRGGARSPAPWAGKLGNSQPAHPVQGGAPSRMLESALEDKDRPFLNPRERRLVKVPLRFESVRHYCSLIAHNMLAEFWHVYREGPRGSELHGTVVSDNELYVDGGDEDGMAQHLLLIQGSVHLVTNQGLAGVDSMKLTVRPALRARGSVSVKSYGYVGSYINELKALIELAEADKISNVLMSVLQPQRDFAGDFVSRKLRPEVPINPSQRRAVEGMAYALEKIQGPPGTGKSTTIFHIICSRVPAGQRVLVTCSRNVAVESIAQKLERCTPDGLIVFGNASRIGETARKYLLDAKCERQPAVSSVADFSRRMQSAGRLLVDGLRLRKTPQKGPAIRCRSVLWKRAWTAYMRRRCLYPQLLKDWALRVGATGLAQVEQIASGCKSDVLRNSLIMLCTIASTGRLLREWEENCREPLNTHTVIVDECGCTTESSVALLMRMEPRNLVMVGDHKQLPPTSMVPPRELEGTDHDRSLLERCVQASGSVHRLVEQYRMHEKICKVVSARFYNSMLETPACVAADRQRKEKRPLVWVKVNGSECVPPKSKSYVNYEEVEVVQQVATTLRERHPDATIAVLTFYKGQLQELMRATPASLQVEVLTVDSCQGSEFDYVVLSTVRANYHGSIGFVKDKQRINVAISRSLYGLVVVGHADTLSYDDDWRAVRDACEANFPAEWQPRLQLPAAGSFETVMDQLKSLQMRKREEALANQEIDAVKLMEHQPSFRPKSFASSNRQASPGFTVIGAKPVASQGKKPARGMGARDKLDRAGRRPNSGADDRWAHKPDPFDLVSEEFPDLDEGTSMLMSQPKKVACRAHGMYGCEACGLDSESASRMPRIHSSHTGASEDFDYARSTAGAVAPSANANANSGRLRIDKAAAARFVKHGIGYSGPMPNSSARPDVGGQTPWARALQMSKDRRSENAAGGLFKVPEHQQRLSTCSADEVEMYHEWHTCDDCGVAGDALEEDSDNPGTYYCYDCWFRWKNDDVAAPVGAYDPNMKEESLIEIFGHLGECRVREVLDQFQDVPNYLERAFTVLLDIGDAKEKCYDDELDITEAQGDIDETDGDLIMSNFGAEAQACGECGKPGLSNIQGRVDDTDGLFYCNECWARLEVGGADGSVEVMSTAASDGLQTPHGLTNAAEKGSTSVRKPGQQQHSKAGFVAFKGIADKAASLQAAARAHAVPTNSELCADCNSAVPGRVDENDGNFYCNACWSTFMAEAAAAPPQMSTLSLYHGGGWSSRPSAQDTRGADDVQHWARSKVVELLLHEQESYLDPDVIVSALLAAETLQDLKQDAQNFLSSGASVKEFVTELWQRRAQKPCPNDSHVFARQQTGGTALASQERAALTGNHHMQHGAGYGMRVDGNTTPEEYVRVGFQQLGIDDPDMEQYIVSILQMKDDALSPIDDGLNQIEDILRGLEVPDNLVRDFVQNAPITAAIW